MQNVCPIPGVCMHCWDQEYLCISSAESLRLERIRYLQRLVWSACGYIEIGGQRKEICDSKYKIWSKKIVLLSFKVSYVPFQLMQ